MAYTNEELRTLHQDVADFLYEKMLKLNRTDELEGYLRTIGYTHDTDEYDAIGWCFNPNTAKILVIAAQAPEQKIIEQTARKNGINPNQIEVILHEKADQFDFKKLRYNFNYSDVIFGPISHKSKGMGDCSNVIALMEANPKEYPHVVRASANQQLKLTKDSFKKALTQTNLYKELVGD